MKTSIFSLILLSCGALSASAGVEVISTEQLSNNKVYLLQRDALSATAGKGYAYVNGSGASASLYSAAASKADTTQAAAHFSFHYSPREKAYYLYNLGAEKFVTGTDKHITGLSASAVDCVPLYSELAEHWLLDCGGYAIAVSDDDGVTLFYDDLTKGRVRTNASHFLITEKFGATVSPETSDAIEAKIAESRTAALKTYRDFLSKAAKVLATNDLPRYLGEYDLEELTYALDHADDYSLAEIEEIYQRTLLSRYPKHGRYYRIHNGARPVAGVAGRPNNYLSTDIDGTLRVRNFENPAVNSATDGYSDDLALFRFVPVEGDPTAVNILAPTFGEYLCGGANAEYIKLGSIDAATTYELTTTSQTGRVFRIGLSAKSTYLSVTAEPEFRLWGYATLEAANQWYFEPIDSLDIPVNEFGYATTCLPCHISMPEGAVAYTVTSLANGKAYVEELASPIFAATPLIIKAPAGAQSVRVAIETGVPAWVGSEMTGNLRATTNGLPGRYVPQFSAAGISFAYQPAADSDCPTPGSCYIVSADLGKLQTVMGANPDAAIEEISADQAASRTLFDLQGRPAPANPRPGIYLDASTRRPLRLN